MSDFELLKSLQNELIETLAERSKIKKWIPNSCSKAKLRRLRLHIQEVMLRIERKCNGYYKIEETEGWE